MRALPRTLFGTVCLVRLVSFTSKSAGTGDPGPVRSGVVVDREIVDLTDSAVGLPGDMCELLAAGDDALEPRADLFEEQRETFAVRVCRISCSGAQTAEGAGHRDELPRPRGRGGSRTT